MKKRVLSLLLLLSTVLSLFPVAVLSAEETLPKDETQSVSTETAPTGTNGFTAYDALYVGADGAKTANGGSLIGLYTAYGDDATVDLTNKKWKNKMDATGATDIVLRDTLGAVDFVKETSGFGYHLTAKTNTEYAGQCKPIGLNLPDAWAALAQFTVEHSARLDMIDADACYAYNVGAVRLDLLQGLWMPSGYNLIKNDSYCMRWSITGKLGYTNEYAGSQEYAYRKAYESAGEEMGIVASYTKSVSGAGKVSYLISYNTGVSYASAKTYTVAELDAMRADAKNDVPAFSLFNGMGGVFYAVRVYDAPLTEAEKKQNALVDILAYHGIDPSKYTTLGAGIRTVLAENISTMCVTGDRKAVESTMESLIASFTSGVDPEDTLYVTNGLTFLATAYIGLSTGSYDAAGTINWLNAVDPSEFVALRGGFAENEAGGYTVVKDLAAYKADSGFGMYLPATALPRKDYTVEFVYNPVGISTTDENGALARYVDDVSPTGTHHNISIAIGPLRALQFACYRPTGKDGQMERRWYYTESGTISSLGYKYHHADTAWKGLGLHDVMSYSIAHSLIDDASKYLFYSNASHISTYDIDKGTYRTPEQSGNMFQLLVGLAGTAYSVRVYDRALSRNELLQNRFADLVYFYDIDVGVLEGYIKDLGDAADVLYAAYADMSFTMTKKEAAAYFAKQLAAIWVGYEGLGVRKGAEDGIRYYFKWNGDAAGAMAQNGFAVEIGAVVNVGKNELPLLTGENYDYRIVGYDSVSGRNTSFFVDDDTFAVTVLYDNVEKKVGLTNVLVRGYVKLKAADGTETVYYKDLANDTLDPSTLFGVYEHMKGKDTVRASADTYSRIQSAVEKCYEKVTVYVDAAAKADGNGSKDTPYRGFAQGLVKCKELLAKANTPTRVILLLADGEYGVYETQTIKGDEMPYRYGLLEITSANGKSTLTTTKNINKSFTEYADNVWVCQLDKEADGSYPCFRYLYVDGKMADLSYSGGRFSYDEDTHTTVYERTYDGPWGRAYQLYRAGRLTADSKADYPSSRPDLIASFERYKIKFLALMEMEEQVSTGTLNLQSTCSSADEVFVEAYESYKLRHLVISDLKGQYNRLTGSASAKKTAFKSVEPKTYPDDEAYRAAFISLRDTIAALQTIDFDPYLPMVETTARAEAKYYLHEEIVGDLREAMEAGRKRNMVAYNDLLAKYIAADAAGKAALEDGLVLAAEKIADETWFRYALEDYGPEMHLAGQWWYNIIHLAGVDYDDTVTDNNGDVHVAVYLEKDEYRNYYVHQNYAMTGRYVHMKGALSYVDSEGEFYYDHYTGKVYYYSESGVKDKTFARATNDYMLYIDGAAGITVSNLRFTGMDDDFLSHNDGCMNVGTEGGMGELLNDGSDGWSQSAFDRSAILMDDCFGLTVTDCTFEELGARAIFGRGKLENLIFESNTFVRLGGSAIHLGDATKEKLWKKEKNYIENVLVTDNYVHDVAREYYNAAAIWLNLGKDVTITHNTVDKCSYSGICVGYTFNNTTWIPGDIFHMYNVEIAYNYIANFMHEIGDGGAIYLTGCNADAAYTELFNLVHHNYVMMTNNTGNGLGHMLVGIYFDGSTSNWKCYENVVVEQSYGAVKGENDDLFAEGDPYTVALRKRYSGTTFIYVQHISSQLTHNILCDNNYILNVRATDPALQQKEVYKTYIVAARNIKETNTRYVNGIDRTPIGAEDIIYAAGSYGHEGDPYVLYDNNY